MRGSSRFRWAVLAPAVVAVLALAGCASLGGPGTGAGGAGSADGGSGTDGTDGTGGTGGTEGAAQPLLQVVRAGGFVPMGSDFRTVPELTVYPDGTAITYGAQILIYPGPALPALVATPLGEAGLDAVVDAAREAGLLAEAPDYGQPAVTDVPTTTVTLRVDGKEYVHSAYALEIGLGEDLGTADGLEADAVEARAALTHFLQDVHGQIAAHEADGELLTPDRFGVIAQPVTEEAMTLEEGVERQVLPWSVDGVDLADASECVTVDGEAGTALAAALAEANQLTVFEDGGVRYEVFPRPFLPHERGCGDL